ncbi:MAG: DUF3536 domain-containing protein, partial [Symploca sp. SIO2B6]|nr:DUF3536 domain-containing protein [Symploca sp. SIO2B6]
LVFGVFHLGGWDFHCCITPFTGRLAYSEAKSQLIEVFNTASIARMISVMNQVLGEQSYSLQDLFAEERHRIMRLLSQKTLTRLDQLYSQVYRDNYSILMAFHRDQLEVPQELQVAAEIAIGHRIVALLNQLEREVGDDSVPDSHTRVTVLAELDAIATEAQQFHCNLRLPQAKQTVEDLILRTLWQLLHAYNPATVTDNLQWLQSLIAVSDRLNLDVKLDRAQELYLQTLNDKTLPELVGDNTTNWTETHPTATHLQHLVEFGRTLKLDL